MKILCGGDLHIRVTAPEHRIDDFVETQKEKIFWVLNLAKEEGCKIILFPGDVTDHSKLPYWIIRQYILMFRETPNRDKITVRGQHDMLYHVATENTPLMLMEAAKAISIVGIPPKPYNIFNKETPIHIFGVSWEEEIPEIEKFGGQNTVDILLIHKMFVDEKLWEGQEEYKRANIFLRETQWDLIVSGDNHQHFMLQSKGRFHVNCGSLMRQNIDQINHKPVVYIYDTEERTLAPHYIPIRPAEEVFSIDEARKKKAEDERMLAFVEMVRNTTEIKGLDYAKSMDDRLGKKDISRDIKELHKEVMKNVAEKLGDK